MSRSFVRERLAPALLAALLGTASANAATIEGQVRHPSRPEAGAGLSVWLRGLARDGKAIEREGKTDALGRYRFDALPADAAYLVGTVFEEVRFAGGVIGFAPLEAARVQTADIEIYDRSSDASAVSIEHEQWIVDREAGVYRMQLGVAIRNASEQVVVTDAEAAPALRIGLARGAGEVRSTFGALPEGVEQVDGTLEFRGPIYPGETDYRFLYTLGPAMDPAGSPRPLDTEIEIPDRIRDLSLYLKDFGIEADAGPLHASRPTREGDVFYLNYVGFDLPAHSVVPLRIEPLPPREPVSAWVQAAGVTLLAGVLFWFVAAPLSLTTEGTAGAEAEAESSANAALETALSDLEHDYETGKLSDEDREQLRSELESFHRASSRDRDSARAASAPSPHRCDCGRLAEAGDRFCAACGSPI